jgi:hypothetical protein
VKPPTDSAPFVAGTIPACAEKNCPIQEPLEEDAHAGVAKMMDPILSAATSAKRHFFTGTPVPVGADRCPRVPRQDVSATDEGCSLTRHGVVKACRE